MNNTEDANGGSLHRAGSADTMLSTAYIRIYSRCPACHNDTLMINKGRLLCTWHKCSDPTLIDRLGDHAERPPDDYTYASKQATNCAVCGQRKHTPLRNDEMGGYVCLTCIDRELEKLQAANPQNADFRRGDLKASNNPQSESPSPARTGSE